MSDELREDIDLTDTTADDLEKPGLQPGWYVVHVDNVKKDAGSGALLLKFVVDAGEREGDDITERLWSPAGAKDEAGAKRAKDRRRLFAKRLGLIPEDAWGNNASIDWGAAIGRHCAIHVKKSEKKDAAGKVTAEYVNVDFGGIYPVDDQRVPEDIRKLAADADIKPGGGGPVKDPFTDI